MEDNLLSVPRPADRIPTPEPTENEIKRSRSTVMLENTILDRGDNFEVGDWETCEEIYKRHKERCHGMVEEERETHLKLLRFHSGWWGSDEKVAYNGPSGKTMNVDKLRQTLVLKTMEWFDVHDAMLELMENINSSGIFVFQHKTIQCFRFVGKASNILGECQKLIYGSLGGTMLFEPFLPILLSTLATEWGFYFQSIDQKDSIDNTYNETIFKHHTLWPFGANSKLELTPATLPEIRRAAQKWRWPPLGATDDTSMDTFDMISDSDISSSKFIGVDKVVSLSSITYSEYRQFIIENDNKNLERYNEDVKKMYDLVNMVKTRYNAFIDSDWQKLHDIVKSFNEVFMRNEKSQIRSLKIDMRLQSGWWGLDITRGVHEFNGRIMNLPCLTDVLIRKSTLWYTNVDESDLYKNIGQPGIYCFQHKNIPHFRYVGKSENVLDSVRLCLNDSLTACHEFSQLAALLLCTKAEDWYFYFITTEEKKYLDIDFNDLILKHDSLWPHGLNRELEMNPLTLGDMQLSCVKYKWPQERTGNKVLPLPPAVLHFSD